LLLAKKIRRLEGAIKNPKELSRKGYLGIDFSKNENVPPVYFIAKVLKQGKRENLFGFEYSWYLVHQIGSEDENGIKLNFFTRGNQCVGNISHLKKDWEEAYEERDFLYKRDHLSILKSQFAQPLLEKTKSSNLKGEERKNFFVGLCLEEITNSYLHSHEAYHVSNPFKEDPFAEEFMAYLYQMYEKPSYATLFYMFNLAENRDFQEEGRAVRQIMKTFFAYSKTNDPKKLVTLPLSEFKEMSRVVYVQSFQDRTFIDYFRSEKNPIVFKD
jgi:hypothetical protein